MYVYRYVLCMHTAYTYMNTSVLPWTKAGRLPRRALPSSGRKIPRSCAFRVRSLDLVLHLPFLLK